MTTSKSTPREFLGVVGGAIAVGAVTSLQWCVADAVSSLTVQSGGARFAQPRELVSADGRLDVELVAAASQVAFGDGKRFASTCNGTTPGTTLRVRPGDVLTIRHRSPIGTAHVRPDRSSELLRPWRARWMEMTWKRGSPCVS